MTILWVTSWIIIVTPFDNLGAGLIIKFLVTPYGGYLIHIGNEYRHGRFLEALRCTPNMGLEAIGNKYR